MAKLQKRLRADGGTSFRVMWVVGGGRAIPGAAPGTAGSQASETFTDERLMLAFKLAVEAQDHQWPRGWVKGRGWVDPEDVEVVVPTLDQVVQKWRVHELDKLTLGTKKGKTLGKDIRTYELHIKPVLGNLPVTAITREDVRAWVTGMSACGAAPKSVSNRHGLLFQILNSRCWNWACCGPIRARAPRCPAPRSTTTCASSTTANGRWSGAAYEATFGCCAR